MVFYKDYLQCSYLIMYKNNFICLFVSFFLFESHFLLETFLKMEKYVISNKKKIVLVTGGSGLVGFAIQQICKIYNDCAFVFMKSEDCDLTNYEQTISYFEHLKPDYVIHLAANVGGLFKNMKYKVDMFEKNIMMNMNVLKASHTVGVKKLVGCLSTCIFPDKTTYPIDETMLHNGEPHFSNDAYAYAKRMLDVQCKAYREQYGDDFICVIPTNIYGENDNYNLENAHVIPALIHKCFLAKKEGKEFVVAGSGKPLRQFIYSRDLAKLICIILFYYDSPDTIILSVDEDAEISIGDVAKMIAEKFEYSHMLKYDSSKPDGQFKKTACNKKLKDFIEEEKISFDFTSMDEGLHDSIQWFLDNYDNCRK